MRARPPINTDDVLCELCDPWARWAALRKDTRGQYTACEEAVPMLVGWVCLHPPSGWHRSLSEWADGSAICGGGGMQCELEKQ